MKIDIGGFSGSCDCGRAHKIDVKEILIERGAIDKIADMTKDGFLNAYTCPLIICDGNTYEAAAFRISDLIPGSSVIILPAKGLHADNHGVEMVLNQYRKGTDLIYAVGAGTIHDISRYVAKQKQVPFVSVPTAASVDGFVSTVAAMTWDGMKKTIPAVSPICVVADTDVFSIAPYRLTASGVSDLLGKYTALADWRISHIVTGEYLCETVCDLEMQAVEAVKACSDELKENSTQAYEKLMYALLLSGLAMQMIGNSRPASGAEHHVSHLWEMEVINPHTDAYHGEKVSAGFMLLLDEYHRIEAAIKEGKCQVRAYEGLELTLLQNTFGEKGLFEGVMTENTPDPLALVDIKVLGERLNEISLILEQLPSKEQMSKVMGKAGCVQTMEEAGVNSDIKDLTLQLSPYVRNRLTFMRLSKLLIL